MPDHAIWQVQNAMITIAQRDMPSGLVVTFAQDRDLTTDPFSRDELPGLSVRCPGFSTEPNNYQSQEEHRATFQFSVVTGESVALGIGRRAAEIIGHIDAIFHADRTLGGLTQPVQTQGAVALEQQGPDIGVVTLEVLAVFTTPRGDHFTLIP